MERDETILQEILQGMHNLRTMGYLTEQQIRREINSSLRHNELEHYLSILKDRKMIESKTHTHKVSKIPGHNNLNKITGGHSYKQYTYRITDKGLKFVKAGFKNISEHEPLKVIVHGDSNQVMIASPGGSQTQTNHELKELFLELRQIIEHFETGQAKQDAIEMVECIEEETAKEVPRPGVVKRMLDGLKEYRELIPVATMVGQEVAKMFGN